MWGVADLIFLVYVIGGVKGNLFLIHLIISVQFVCITGSSATALEEHHVLKNYKSLTVDSTGGACVENIVYAT